MKSKFFTAAVVICSLNSFSADNGIDVESLKRELKELRQRTEQLEKKIDAIEAASPPAPITVTNQPSASVTSTPAPGTTPPPPLTHHL